MQFFFHLFLSFFYTIDFHIFFLFHFQRRLLLCIIQTHSYYALLLTIYAKKLYDIILLYIYEQPTNLHILRIGIFILCQSMQKYKHIFEIINNVLEICKDTGLVRESYPGRRSGNNFSNGPLRQN